MRFDRPRVQFDESYRNSLELIACELDNWYLLTDVQAVCL